MSSAEQPVHDLVGIGFGPNNLALAIALRERAEIGDEPVDAVFLEKQLAFGWHRGMLLDDTTMQVSFLKDLVTMRNPASGFSFLSYLREKGRLVDFIHHKTMFPSRLEFHDYLDWAAARFTDQVWYGTEVVAVEPVRGAGAGNAVERATAGDEVIEVLDVVARDTATGRVRRYRTRNVVVAAGLEPALPAEVTPGERVWHSAELLHRMAALHDPRRIVVVGAGQSAAEVTAHMHGAFPDAEVCAVFAKYGYTPADDSPFANRIFDPVAVDHFFAADSEVKDLLQACHASTNYSVVDMELIEELYRRHYQEKVRGRERLRICNASRVTHVAENGAGVKVTVRFLPTGEETVLDADVIIYATGYRPVDPLRLLGPVGARCARDGDGRIRLRRDYRVVTDDALRCGIFVQGASEHSHGISSTLLSNTAVRAGEIARAVARRPNDAYALCG